MRKVKQRIDKSEDYCTHIGYTRIIEVKHRLLMKNPELKKRGFGRTYVERKIRPVVKKRLAKLERYWRASI